MHFIEHIFLISTGVVIILLVTIPDFHKTLTFLALIICIPSCLGIFYMLNIIFGAIKKKMNKNPDFTLDEITKLSNNIHPIDSIFKYITGYIRKKKHDLICRSDEGVDVPIESKLTSPPFIVDGKEPDFFYLIITQKVNMTDQLSRYIEQEKFKIISCENRFSAVTVNYPIIEGKNFITTGKKLPFKLTKNSAIASIVFGVSIYYEMFEKSIPIKRFTQTLDASCTDDLNYTQLISNLNFIFSF